MIKIFYIILSFSVFVYYIFRIIKKKKNPTLNGAMAAVFGLITWIDISPYISKIIKTFIE